MNKRQKILVVVLLSLLGLGCTPPEEKAQAFLESADELYEQGDYKRAEIEYRNALKYDNTLVDALFKVAMINQKNQKYDKSVQFLNKVLDYQPEHVAALTERGKIEVAAGMLDRALSTYEKLSALAPNTVDTLTLHSLLLYNLDDRHGAGEEAKMVLSQQPDNVDAVTILAQLAIDAENYDEALNWANKGLSLEPSSLVLNTMKMSALYRKGDIQALISTINKLIEFYPDNLKIRAGLAQLLVEQNDLLGADQVYQRMTAEVAGIQPKLDHIQFLLGYFDDAKAEAQLKEYIAKGGDEVTDLTFALAELYLRIGEKEQAAQTYQKIIAEVSGRDDVMMAKSQLALMAIEANKLDEARKLINEVLEEDGAHNAALTALARIYLIEGDVDMAIHNLRAALASDNNSQQTHELLAQAYRAMGEEALARDHYIKAVKIDPDNIGVAIDYAKFLISLKDIDQADMVLSDILRSYPARLDVLQLLAQVKLQKQAWSEAQEISDRLELLGGDKEAVYQIRGLALQGKKDFDQSISTFKEAFKASSNSARPLVSLVRAYLQAGKAKEAERFIKSVIDVNPKNIYAYIILARLSYLDQKVDKAESILKEALSINPEEPIAYSNLSKLYITMGKLDDAKTLLNSSLEKLGNNVDLQLTLAEALIRSGQLDAAILLYRNILEEDPRIAIALNNLASLLLDHHNDKASHEEALQLAKRLKSSKIPSYVDTLGWAHYRLGEYEQASRYFNEALEYAPEGSLFRYHLALTEKAMGHPTLAKRELEKVLEDDPKAGPHIEEARKLLAELN